MGAVDYIDVKRTAISVLKDWNNQRFKLEHEAERLKEIQSDMLSLKGTALDRVPVKGGTSKREERLCNAIDRKAVAMQALKSAREYDQDVTPCWERLTFEEQFCLTARFIDHEEGDGIKRIMERFCVERSEAYRRSDAALDRFSRMLFW